MRFKSRKDELKILNNANKRVMEAEMQTGKCSSPPIEEKMPEGGRELNNYSQGQRFSPPTGTPLDGD